MPSILSIFMCFSLSAKKNPENKVLLAPKSMTFITRKGNDSDVVAYPIVLYSSPATLLIYITWQRTY
jgi:hypothetical protein